MYYIERSVYHLVADSLSMAGSKILIKRQPEIGQLSKSGKRSHENIDSKSGKVSSELEANFPMVVDNMLV